MTFNELNPEYTAEVQVTNSVRGYFGYKNYKPFEIKVLRRIARLGYKKGRLGRFRWGIFWAPLLYGGYMGYLWYIGVYRRNRNYTFDQYRDLANKLTPLYRHETDKANFGHENKLRRMQRIAQMELNDDFDFDDMRIYHFPRRHPDLTISPQMSPMNPF